ncbi:hypothetical protein NFC81_09215 [Salinispirillum sp. LH 10-3-1]|uniref:Uncharacterized protein n=1 Tax=Salinispirillum sp. LH 10-3-1 TaxID=2952525 RepID=A0AB38YDF6_9GAMM
MTTNTVKKSKEEYAAELLSFESGQQVLNVDCLNKSGASKYILKVAAKVNFPKQKEKTANAS